MTRTLLFLGGPLHGRHITVEDGQDTVHASMRSPSLTAAYERNEATRQHLIKHGADPDELTLPLLPTPRTITYHRSRIQILGWRLPLPVMTNWPPGALVPDGCVLPGYVHGVPAEHELLPNPPPLRCTCSPLADIRRYLHGPNLSSCHLDHCPTHGPFHPRETP